MEQGLDLRKILRETRESANNGHSIQKLEEWKEKIKNINDKKDRQSLRDAIDILELVIKLKKKKGGGKLKAVSVSILLICAIALINNVVAVEPPERFGTDILLNLSNGHIHAGRLLVGNNSYLDLDDEFHVYGDSHLIGNLNVTGSYTTEKVYLEGSGSDYIDWCSADDWFRFSAGIEAPSLTVSGDLNGNHLTTATGDITDYLLTPIIRNTDGDTVEIQDNLDITGSVANDENGRMLKVCRQAPEGNNCMELYITGTRKGMIHSNADMTLQGQTSFTINSVDDNIFFKLGDSAGYKGVHIRDKSGMDVSTTDSNGNAWYRGDVSIGVNSDVFIQGNGDSYFNGGKIGIGTKTPSKDLDVYKSVAENEVTIRAYNSNESGIGRIVAGAYGGGQISMVANSKSSEYLGIPVGFSGLSNNYGDMIFAVGNGGLSSERMRITDGGDIGIGTKTPSEKLHIYNGNMRIEGSTDPTFYFTRTSDNDTFGFKYDESENDFSIVMGNNNRNPSFLDDIMTFTPSFRVGIKQSNPTVELDVNGNTRLDGNLEVTGNIEPLTFPLATGTKLDLYGGNYALGVESSELRISSNARITFRTDGYEGNEDMIIEDDGNILMLSGKLGLKTDNPKEELHINSTNPQIIFEEYDAGNYEKVWEIGATNEEFLIRTQNDVYSGSQTILRLGGRGGTSVGYAEFPSSELRIGDLNTGSNTGTHICVDVNDALCRCGSCA